MLFKLLLYEALLKGGYRGLRLAFRKKKGFHTTADFNRVLKQVYLQPLREALNQPTALWDDPLIHEVAHRHFIKGETITIPVRG